MSHQLQIIARATPGALERILRTLRVRGFELHHLAVELDAAAQRYRLQLRVEGARALSMLERQLEKLVEVEQLLAMHAGGGARPAQAAP